MLSCINLFIRSIVTLFLFFVTLNSYASNNETIYTTSINWDDVVAREKILAQVPKWQEANIKSVYDIYLHPEHHQLPKKKDVLRYNMQFINAFWGPLNN